MGNYELGDKVELHGLPEFQGEAMLNGRIGKVVALPGFDADFPECYGLEIPSIQLVVRAVPRFLRPYPPKLPNGRGDIDKKTTWAEFDAMTGLRSRSFREGYDASPAT